MPHETQTTGDVERIGPYASALIDALAREVAQARQRIPELEATVEALDAKLRSAFNELAEFQAADRARLKGRPKREIRFQRDGTGAVIGAAVYD